MLDLTTFRLRSYAHVMGQAHALAGVKSLWAVNLQSLPKVRRLAWEGRLDRLECVIGSAKAWAWRTGFLAAAKALDAKERELAALRGELAAHQAPPADVVVLSPDWGKPGRAAKILAWIATKCPTAAEVAERFQLALSTAKKYLRRARKERPALAA